MEKRLEAKECATHAPVRELLTLHRRSVIIGIGVTCLNAVAFYLLLSYMPTYLSTEMGMSESDSFMASTVSLATYIGLIFPDGQAVGSVRTQGHVADRIGAVSGAYMAAVRHVEQPAADRHPDDPDSLRRDPGDEATAPCRASSPRYSRPACASVVLPSASISPMRCRTDTSFNRASSSRPNGSSRLASMIATIWLRLRLRGCPVSVVMAHAAVPARPGPDHTVATRLHGLQFRDHRVRALSTAVSCP
ncbi:hypothetical protein L1887_59178 [Cichorium endivia]|nr:hypothetical protein L1887_59178 [Cichorium endivia]